MQIHHPCNGCMGASSRHILILFQDETEVTGVTAARSSPDQAAAEETGSGYGAPRAAATEQGYGAPRVAATEQGYGAPDGSGEEEASGEGSGEAAGRTEEGYSAPEGDYGAPSSRTEEAYGAPGGYQPGGDFPFSSVEAGGRGPAGGECPGGDIEACVEVCPGTSTRVYGACVRGCDKRCPE